MGLVAIAKAAAKEGMLPERDAERIASVVRALGLSIEPPVPVTTIMRAVRYDKKRQDNILRVVIPEAIGRCVVREMSFEHFENMFK